MSSKKQKKTFLMGSEGTSNCGQSGGFIDVSNDCFSDSSSEGENR